MAISHSGDLGTWATGSSLSQQLFACCAPGYAWSVIGGAMPAGLSLSSGGQLTAAALNTAGVYTFLVQVQDTTAPSRVAALPFTFASRRCRRRSLRCWRGQRRHALDLDLTVTGASGPVTWTLEPFNVLPPGLQLSLSSGAWSLDGTPTHSGQFSFALRATDGAGNVLTRSLTLSVYPAGVTPPVNILEGSNFGTLAIGEIQQGLTPRVGPAAYHMVARVGRAASRRLGSNRRDLPPWFLASQNAGLIGIATTRATTPSGSACRAAPRRSSAPSRCASPGSRSVTGSTCPTASLATRTRISSPRRGMSAPSHGRSVACSRRGSR